MNEQELEIFITAADDFFLILGGERAEIGESRIEFGEPPLLDHTAMIEVGGNAQGAVYFTAGSKPLVNMLDNLNEDTTEELKEDLLGELTGTVVMNAREHFGEKMSVAIPKVYGRGESPPSLDRISYVTPMQWGGGEIDMIIALKFD